MRLELVPFFCAHCRKVVTHTVPTARVWCRCGKKAKQGEGKAKETA